jgi:hypothetical protein
VGGWIDSWEIDRQPDGRTDGRTDGRAAALRARAAAPSSAKNHRKVKGLRSVCSGPCATMVRLTFLRQPFHPAHKKGQQKRVAHEGKGRRISDGRVLSLFFG